MRWIRWLTALIVAALAAQGAWAQQKKAAPGEFDYFLLALTWQPAFCADHRGDLAAEAQCARSRGFVVHGLWPQNEDGSWPAFCRNVPPVPAGLAARESTAIPDAGLIEHEWEKHGSCTVWDADGYFARLERAFAAVRIPAPLRAPTRAIELPLAEAKRQFAAANPGLAPAMMAMRCDRRGTLLELRFCLDKTLGFRPCASGEGDSCPASIRLPPAATGG